MTGQKTIAKRLQIVLVLIGVLVIWGWAENIAAETAVPQAPNAIFTVDVLGDDPDANVGDGLCDSDLGTAGTQCTLRAAIMEANATAGLDTVLFSFSGSGPWNIFPFAELPSITDPIIIDGVSGNGTCPTASSPASLSIILNGFFAGAFADGLTLSGGSSGSTIQGLVIGNFDADGIQISGTSGSHTIRCNHIGLGADGVTGFGNNGDGVDIASSLGSNTVGGTSASDRNVISDNDEGVYIFGADDNVIQGNFIGTDASGLNNVGNTGAGVHIYGAEDNLIGGVGSGEANLIAFSGWNGVSIGYYSFAALDANGNIVRGNNIHSNDDLGIDLTNDGDLTTYGVTVNDSGDGDSGGNNLQNFPVLTSASTAGIVVGNINSTASTFLTIDFYRNSSCDSTGYGEGEEYLGVTNVTTDGSGDATINYNLGMALSPGDVIVATATNIFGDTSEFSACVTVTDATFVVDTNGNRADSNPGDGVCDVTGSSTNCSLRAAIEEVNALGGGPHRIDFNIGGTGPHTISPGTPFPDITVPVMVNGLSQAGAQCPVGANPATLQIALDGTNAGSTNGLTLAAGSDGSIIRGLVIGSFELDGIEVQSSDNRVRCNHIGIGVDGTTDRGNGERGVHVNAGDDNIIGGVVDTYRNVISSNVDVGVRLDNNADNTLIQGNLIGLTADGLDARGNGGAGIRVDNSDSVIIGDTAAFGRNVVSNNGSGGIRFSNGADLNLVINNYVGTDAFGAGNMGNSGIGINLSDADFNTIGGPAAGEANTIMHNTGDGIRLVDNAGRNEIRANIISDNGALGIDIDNDGVTPNDSDDSDAGTNDLQNYPVITGAAGSTVTGTLRSEANSDFTIDLYRNLSCDSSGSGEGAEYLGSVSVTTNGSNLATFATAVPVTLATGEFVAATATHDLRLSTSEFSECFLVTADTFIVNTTADDADANPGDAVCDTGSGDCSLRAAFEEVNAQMAAGPTTIHFNIPGSGAHVISPQSPLPPLTSAIDLDGISQPGASCPTPATIAMLPVRLNGANAGIDVHGIDLQPGSDGSRIRGLVIGNFGEHGINVESNNNTIRCNHIGVSANGINDIGNENNGIRVKANGNLIGGSGDVHRNVISGNDANGIRFDAGSTGNEVKGNIIGLTAFGTAVLPNANAGIRLANSDENTIGGFGAVDRNVVSGNGDFGIYLTNSHTNTLQTNYIGTNALGTLARGNTNAGIYIFNSNGNNIGGELVEETNLVAGNIGNGIRLDNTAISNTIKGNEIGVNGTGTLIPNTSNGVSITGDSDGNRVQANTIAGNGTNGVRVSSDSQRNRIRGNDVYTNTLLGIDLNGDGVDVNDSGDSDAGGNETMNYPVLATAVGSLGVAGTLNTGQPSAEFTFDFFRSDSCDASGNGEGQTYLDSAKATSNLGGVVDFGFFLDVSGVNPGDQITATATDPNGNTSEFSQCITVQPGVVVNKKGDNGDLTAGDGVCDTQSKAGVQCSLRAAIEEVNAQAAITNTILFVIDGTGPHTITLGSMLPAIDTPVVVDATSAQPGAACHDSLQIVIDGSGVAGTTVGVDLGIGSDGSVVQGLAVGGFSFGLRTISSGNVLRCNHVGVLPDGVTPLPNGNGIKLLGSGNRVGGLSADDTNVVSGNSGIGIDLGGSNHRLLRNFVGTDSGALLDVGNGSFGVLLASSNNILVDDNTISGNNFDGIRLFNSNYVTMTGNAIGWAGDLMTPLPNSGDGIRVTDSDNVRIGGISGVDTNFIGANGGNGVYLDAAVDFATVAGNFIGESPIGSPAGNGLNGIHVDGANDTSIGGVDRTYENVITDSGDNGILVSSGERNRIFANVLYSNTLLGIDLGADGAVTPNDVDDGDGGANLLQNYPLLTRAFENGGATAVAGNIQSTPNSTLSLDFYRNLVCDASGYGEGVNHRGSMTVNTDSSGVANFTYTLNGTAPVGEEITVTATDPSGNTSEFSACQPVVACTPPAVVNPTPSISGSDFSMLWTPATGATLYLVYRSIDDPYFTPGQVYEIINDGSATSWLDTLDNDELGNPAENHYYLIQGGNSCGFGSPGQRVGEFDFAIVPGS